MEIAILSIFIPAVIVLIWIVVHMGKNETTVIGGIPTPPKHLKRNYEKQKQKK